jgi:hypothetical protein
MTEWTERIIVPKGVKSKRLAQTVEVLREGNDVAIVASGALAETAVRAAQKLGKEGISAKVINGRFPTPHDARRLSEVAHDVKAILILEEDTGWNESRTVISGEVEQSDATIPTRVLSLDTHTGDRQKGPTGSANADAVVRSILRLTERDKAQQAGLSDALSTVGSPNRGTSPSLKKPRRPSAADDYFGFPKESIRRERELIGSAKLSTCVDSWFDIYSRVGYRPRYLWKWCTYGADLTTIAAVLPEWRRHVCDTKVLSIMLCVLLDDVADEQGNEQLLEALMQIVERKKMPVMSGFSEEDRECAAVTLELTEIYENRVSKYPLYEFHKRLLRFDLMQYFNTMRYSCLLNRNLNLLNVTEHELYLPHAMHMMSFSTLDLMCTPDFGIHELGRFREAIWHAQCMGRVGNLLSTWEREIAQTDFTSGVFARAVIEGELRVDQLRVGEAPAIEAAIVGGGHEQHYLSKWYEHRECLRKKVSRIHSIDLQDFVESQERFFLMHLACRGTI